MTTSTFLSFNDSLYYEHVPLNTPNFNTYTLSWYVKTSTKQSTPRFGIYGGYDSTDSGSAIDDSENHSSHIIKNVSLFQIYEGNFCYSGNNQDYGYQGIFKHHEEDDVSYLNKWNHHVLVYDALASDANKLQWYYNDEQLYIKEEFLEGKIDVYPQSSSYSGPANSIRIWFGIFEPGPGDAIANVEFFDGANTPGSYGNAGFQLTFNPSDINTEVDAEGTPIDIDDPYGSSVILKQNWLADISGTGNHWLINGL